MEFGLNKIMRFWLCLAVMWLVIAEQ